MLDYILGAVHGYQTIAEQMEVAIVIEHVPGLMTAVQMFLEECSVPLYQVKSEPSQKIPFQKS